MGLPLQRQMQQAQTKLRLGRLDEAEQICHRVLKLLPKQPFFLAMLGQIEYLRRAKDLRALEPTEEDKKHIIDLYYAGDYLTAEIAARMFIQEHPDHPLGWQVLGGVLHQSGRLKEALEVRTETAAKFPTIPNCKMHLEETRAALGLS